MGSNTRGRGGGGHLAELDSFLEGGDAGPAPPPPVPEADPFDSLAVNDLGVDEAVLGRRATAPRAKLDAERLLGDRGLPSLDRYVRRVKFKGRGHERRDLAKLLGAYQLWAHRLFPKANFDDFLQICMRVGTTAPLRAYRNRLIDDEKYGSGPNSEKTGDVEQSMAAGLSAEHEQQHQIAAASYAAAQDALASNLETSAERADAVDGDAAFDMPDLDELRELDAAEAAQADTEAAPEPHVASAGALDVVAADSSDSASASETRAGSAPDEAASPEQKAADVDSEGGGAPESPLPDFGGNHAGGAGTVDEADEDAWAAYNDLGF